MLYYTLDIHVCVMHYITYTIYTVYTLVYVCRSGDPVPQGQERLRQDPQRVRLKPRPKG